MLAIFALGGMEILVLLFILPVVALAFAFWIWMLVDCITNQGLDSNEKMMWVLVIALTHWLGALIYLCVARAKRNLPAPGTPIR